jgi:myo-inositol-1(or 4)-monophosphatase
VGAHYVRARATDLDSIGWELKSRSDFVSDVDRGAEERIAAVLREHFPDAAVLGEELSHLASVREGVAFVVDPLDGTTNFLHGYPQYAVSVAATVDGALMAGSIVDIPRQSTYRASLDGGAWQDGRPLRVSRVVDPSRSLIGTGFPFKRGTDVGTYLSQLGALCQSASGVRRAGAAALDLADLAAGRLDGFWELMLAPWDIAAGVLLIREAGGRVTDLDGADVKVDHSPIVASNAHLHSWLLDVLAGAR